MVKKPQKLIEFFTNLVNFSGIKLRKVEQLRDDIRQQKQSNLHDVASILARRVAIELSDSESDSEDSDEEWMEPNETSAWYNEKQEKLKSEGKKK